MNQNPIHPVYMPYTREQLSAHFGDDKHVDYFVTSAVRYIQFINSAGPQFSQLPITHQVRLNRQIEKDERFWTACTLKAVFDAGRFAHVLKLAFPNSLPAGDSSWEQAAGEHRDQELRFEVAISSPKRYREFLRDRFLNGDSKGHIIPYVHDAGQGRTAYEGATKCDAVFLNRTTGLSVMFEAKVLSDVSCDVTFDSQRNQLARNIDVMLSDSAKGTLAKDPARRFFALLTPAPFKKDHTIRFYGFLFDQYTKDPSCLANHLGHRDPAELRGVSDRIGWLTFEECQSVCHGCSPWLPT